MGIAGWIMVVVFSPFILIYSPLLLAFYLCILPARIISPARKRLRLGLYAVGIAAPLSPLIMLNYEMSQGLDPGPGIILWPFLGPFFGAIPYLPLGIGFAFVLNALGARAARRQQVGPSSD